VLLRVRPRAGWRAIHIANFNRSYLGCVATATAVPYQTLATTGYMMSRSAHIARDDITALQLVIPNWVVTSNAETGPGSSCTVTASVEYPAGTFKQVTFSGATSILIADAAQAISDFVSVAIPNGATFFVRIFRTGFSNSVCPYTLTTNSGQGSVANYGAGSGTDQTMSGTIANTGGGHFAPAAILAMTTKPSIYLMGDSRTAGVGDTADASLDRGQFARSIGPSYGYINAGCGGDRQYQWLLSNAKRLALAQYCSHVLNGYGINDLTVSHSGATVYTDIQSAEALFPTKPMWVATVSPHSTGAWTLADGSDQTVGTENAQRVALNASIRARSRFLEIADQVESARDSGKWLAPGYTTDGLHATQTGYLAIKNSGAINTGLFTR
jgi:hypothetical protein